MKINNIFIMVTLMFLSCKSIKEPEYTGIKGFKVNKIDLKGIDANIDLGVKNPNSFGFSVYKSSFNVSVGGKIIGKAKSTKRVFIKPNEEKNYTFHLKGSFEGMQLTEVMQMVSGGLKGNINLTGKIKVGKFLIRKGFPVNLNERFKY